MSSTNGGPSFGITTAITVLQNIQQAIVGLSNVITKITAILASNNTWTGTNTFNNFTTFNANADFTGPAEFSGTTIFTGSESFDPPPEIIAGGATLVGFQPAGLLSAQVNSGGVGNISGTGDTPLFSYALPAGALDNTGRTVVIEAFGEFAATANDKDVKLWFGSQVIISTGVVTLTGVGWFVRATLTKNSSNSQVAGAFALSSPSFAKAVGQVLLTQVDTAPITVMVTGASPTTGAANDVLGYGMTVTFMN